MISGLALFPGGVTGVGLLLLRFSVASSLLLLSVARFGGANLMQFLAVLAAISVCVGFRTRAAAGLTLAFPIIAFASGTGLAQLAILHAIDAVALVLTGPGAWSADAVTFGRRTVTFPDPDDDVG
jgi:hypothetical protein